MGAALCLRLCVISIVAKHVFNVFESEPKKHLKRRFYSQRYKKREVFFPNYGIFVIRK